jgi:hypothetical protein
VREGGKIVNGNRWQEKYITEAATAVIELLIMGGKTPETC